MSSSTFAGLWEFAGFFDAPRSSVVKPLDGSRHAALREFLFFDEEHGTFFFAKFAPREPVFFDPDTTRLSSADVSRPLLEGTWRVDGNRLIEVVQDRDRLPRQQEFETTWLPDGRLVIKEPTTKDGQFLEVVYERREFEQFAAPSLPDEASAGRWLTAEPAAAAAHLQTEQQSIGALLNAGRLNSAHRRAQRSVRESASVFGADHPNTAACLATLGACLVKLGDHEGAIEVLESARAICERHTGSDSPATAAVLNNLSPAYRGAQRFRAALDSALQAVRIRTRAFGARDASTATSVQNLGLALSGLGLVGDAMACYRRAVDVHDAIGGRTDPRALAVRENIDRLVTALTTDPRFTGLPPADVITAAGRTFDEVLSTCEQMLATETDPDVFHLRFGRVVHLESYVSLMRTIRLQQIALVEHPAAGDRPTLLSTARQRLLASIDAPLTTFRGTLKRIDRATLGPKALATLRHVFPHFSGGISEAAERDEAFQAFGIERPKTLADERTRHVEALGFAVKAVGHQFRRYSGESNLPSQRYATVGHDAEGRDGGTLCRELFEYTDPRIPGFIFPGDSHDAAFMEALAVLGVPSPNVPGIFVLLGPPMESEGQPVYRQFLGPLLTALYGPYTGAREQWDGLSLMFIPTQVYETEIPDVIDMRSPDTQDWLFRFFRHGDGAVWVKSATTEIDHFTQMLPSLVYPEYGGSGVTKSLGSWLRSAGVQGLVFPSARSNASIQMGADGGLSSFHGWNIVDYRDTDFLPDRLLHVDHNDWYDFIGSRQAAPVLERDGRSWTITGAESRYQQARASVLALRE